MRTVQRLVGEASLDGNADPDVIVDEILDLLSRERFRRARALASGAMARFPDHARVRGAWGIFDPKNKARPSSIGPQPSTREEFDWLKDPPEWARGKWVALVGAEAVATADTLDELMQALTSRDDPGAPLAVRIDAA